MKSNWLWYGGDYYPEQWLDRPDILEKDLEYMKKAGINMVTLGVFSWSFLEPEEGRYRLEWLKERVDKLYENGISTIMGTPSGARPKWLADRYPEVLRVDETRRRRFFGGRHNHCYTSPVYREKVRRIDGELAKQFGTHPGVVMWHISNEFGGECHCPLCQAAFRRWLEKKYGSIETLNRSWCTAFWSHIYQSFDQVESPSSIGESMVHGLNLDWKRFVTEQTADFALWEAASLREAGAGQPTTTNLMYDYTGLNYQRLSQAVDVVSWDSYPLWHKEKEILTARDNGMQHDFMRSLKKRPFLLMESSPSSTNWQEVSKLKRPGLLKLASWQAVAHGSDSVMYFQIRQSRGSSEKFHGAVIDHYGGCDTRVFEEVSQTGMELALLRELAGTGTFARAALIYDVECRWAMEDAQGPRNKGLYYHETCVKVYSAMKKLGFNVDVLTMEGSLKDYRLVAAPMLYLYRNGIEEKLKEFVKGGGQLVTTYWSGIVDETDECFLGGVPHGLREVLGLRSTEIDGLYVGECNYMVSVSGQKENGRYECRNLCDLVKLEGAEALLVYEKDFYGGYPALTRNRYGNGTAYYVCADAGQDFYDDLFQKVTYEAGMKPLVAGEIVEGLEVTSRESETCEYLFLQNFRKEPVRLGCKLLSDLEKGTLLLGEISDSGEIGGYGTIIVRREKTG
ncbi:beta-galactosidase [Clostridium sp. Marseille-P2415]|uniref:beta-galactosidase n=1 Tax=Clostridium sp. Marseille-P2415 TaxID=1805471 RepID=UPI00098884D2|nr:beta-galactosidase [Clostridium sp. Marseille-P2415]